jgi:hypothetical protein
VSSKVVFVKMTVTRLAGKAEGMCLHRMSAYLLILGAGNDYIPHTKSPSLTNNTLEGLGGGLGGGEGGSPLDMSLDAPMVRTVIDWLKTRSQA